MFVGVNVEIKSIRKSLCMIWVYATIRFSLFLGLIVHVIHVILIFLIAALLSGWHI